MSVLVILALLFGMVATFVSPALATAGIVRGAYSFNHNGTSTDRIAIDPPAVTQGDVDAGAILMAHLVATAQSEVINISICPLQAGWTQVEHAGGIDDVVQHIWWRHVTAPQTAFATYTFVSRLGGCDVQSGTTTSITGAITLYTGVDTDNPIGAVASAATSTRPTSWAAPAIQTSHPAGSRVVRYFGVDNQRDIGPTDSTRVYSVGTVDVPRSAAAFDAVLSAGGAVAPFTSSSKTAAWVATTVVLEEPSAPTGPTDTTPPQTTVNSAPYMPGSWTNVPVTVNLSATDVDGSGVKSMAYRASGAETIGPVTVAGASTSVLIASEGVTTVTYAATDNADNIESEQTFGVQVDKTRPALTGEPTTSPNAQGWFSSDVAIGWSCSDVLSGIAGDCPDDSVISGEGFGLSASATVSDRAGNQTTASVTGINIDRTAPATTIAPVPDWSDGPVTVSFLTSDNLSGVQGTYFVVDQGQEQSGNDVVFTESGEYTLRFWSVDLAGNLESPTTIEIKIDSIAPSISHSLSVAPNESGWHRTPVTITFVCADNLSGVASCSEPQTLAVDGAGQTVVGTAVDVAGNDAIDTAIVSIDQTPPLISAGRTPPANGSGWNNSDVVVTYTCSDATSGISVCPAAETVGEGSGQSVSGVATDLAGNSASATVAGISVDLTPPQISVTATLAGGIPYVPDTWVNQPVTVSFSCSDALSGVVSCPAPQVLLEGANQSVTRTAYDIAGNSASATFEQINVDLTAPTIGASLTTADGQPYTPGSWARQAVTVTFDCRDVLSLVASCSAPQSLGDGANQSVTGAVTDAAGNSASTTVGSINVDTVGPAVVATALTADGQPYVPGTWTNQTVTVSFTCADDGSGLAEACPLPVVVSASTTVAGQSVSAQISDIAGHVATSAAIVVMVDKDAPVFTFVPDAQVVEATSDAGAEVTWSVPVAHDAIAGDVSPTCSATPGSLFPLDDTTVTCTATDSSGNLATASFTITVVDTQPPDLDVPEALVVPADSPAGAVVTYDIGAGASLASIAILPDCTPVSGSHFKIGATTVWCSASDAAGNTSTASFTVTVLGAPDLLTTLRGDTISLVTNRGYEHALLRSLDQAQRALQTGQTMRAYGLLLRYRVQVALYSRFGRLSAGVGEQLQTEAQQVTNAMY
ncbi:MAG TPA: HYR domain-containing protein [Thermomicrobiales bacterium]|nr:HYR domain-containing protein [Thermomicrobiales bacterium]